MFLINYFSSKKNKIDLWMIVWIENGRLYDQWS